MTEFKTQTFPKENRHCLQFETDNKDYFLRVQAAARECIDHKPLTNFERIKAMTVEELADLLAKRNFSCMPFCKSCEKCNTKTFSYPFCVAGIKNWLEKEVQEW